MQAAKTSQLEFAHRSAIIRLEGISKRFQSNYHRSAIRSLKRGLYNAIGKELDGTVLSEGERFVLQNFDLAIDEGEAIAIIGKNGVGKTTLLKIVAGLLQPDSGTVKISGRCVPVLGLRAGMAPPLTGHENAEIYFSIIGLNAKERSLALKQAHEFSGLGDAWKKPTRYYSAGMLARLGLSCALHSQPRILLLDEVFSVGDAEFRERGSARLKELSSSGCTMLIATHEKKEVLGFCSRAVWLRNPESPLVGATEEIVQQYREHVSESLQLSDNVESLVLHPDVVFDSFELEDTGAKAAETAPGHTLTVKTRVHLTAAAENCAVRIRFKGIDDKRRPVHIRTDKGLPENLQPGTYELRCDLPALGLKPGRYLAYAEFLIDELSVRRSEEKLLTVTEVSGADNRHNVYYQTRKWAYGDAQDRKK